MNKAIKALSLALLVVPVTYGMEITRLDPESNRLEIASDEDHNLPSKFFISDSDSSGMSFSSDEGALLQAPSEDDWDSDILENIHDSMIVRNLLKDRSYHDMSGVGPERPKRVYLKVRERQTESFEDTLIGNISTFIFGIILSVFLGGAALNAAQ